MTGDNATTKIDPEPELRRSQIEPRGVLQRNLKMLVYLGGAILVIVAAIFSSTGTKTQDQGAASTADGPGQHGQ